MKAAEAGQRRLFLLLWRPLRFASAATRAALEYGSGGWLFVIGQDRAGRQHEIHDRIAGNDVVQITIPLHSGDEAMNIAGRNGYGRAAANKL